MREITDEEIIKAISNLKANKAAGPNGFPLEWYKVIKDLLIPLMKNTYNHDIKTAITPPSLRDAVISLIPKQGKDKMECGSYRPVSILNPDYKIFTHILAKRLKKIPSSNCESSPDRLYPAEAHTRLHLPYVTCNGEKKKNKLQAVLLSLNAEKALDRVS